MKSQCMHCVDPACAAACMLHSLHKDETTGIVSYDPTYCVGCRYCQMACPFNVAKFEFDEAVPKIVKCELCRHRVGDAKLADDGGFSRYTRGHGPACCEVCPRGAVIYGKRAELLAEAKRRLAANPGAYVPKVYGETEAGGTQVLYLSHVPFEKLGLPDYGPQGVPHTAYTIQEGLYKGFAAPVALYVALGAVLWRNRKKERGRRGGGAAVSTHAPVHREVGGPLLTRPFRLLLAIAALGGVMMLWRFAAGLAAVSNLNDGYPWGIWIAFDVVTGTALGCGGYAVALLVYILNKGEYHPLVRPAILTSLLGYGLAVLAVTVDLGRFWELWKVPVYFWRWSHSPQLEVALCVATYVLVLLVELSPAFFEKWRKSPDTGLRSFAEKGLAFVTRFFVLDPRPRAPAADDAPVLARHDDAAAGAEAAPAVVHALAAVPVPRQLRHHGLRRRRAREPRRGFRLRPPSRDRDAGPALEGRDGSRAVLRGLPRRRHRAAGPGRGPLLLVRRRGPGRARAARGRRPRPDVGGEPPAARASRPWRPCCSCSAAPSTASTSTSSASGRATTGATSRPCRSCSSPSASWPSRSRSTSPR